MGLPPCVSHALPTRIKDAASTRIVPNVAESLSANKSAESPPVKPPNPSPGKSSKPPDNGSPRSKR